METSLETNSIQSGLKSKPVGVQSLKSKKRSALIFLSEEEESKYFFPPKLKTGLEELPFEWTIANDLSPAAFTNYLQTSRPEILIGAWKLHCLTTSLLESEGSSLKYLCYLAGSVRQKVERDLLVKGLLVTNWGNIISPSVAEAALMLILGTLRRIPFHHERLHHEGGWREHEVYGESLFNKRVGIHGFGSIAKSLVELLKPFQVQISTYSPSVPVEDCKVLGVHKCQSLEELFSNSEVLVELAPLTPQNIRLVNERLLRLLPRGACFVNVGRGKVVDEEALCKLCSEGHLYLGLDVFEKEPLPPDSKLRGMENALLIPHRGGPTKDWYRNIGEVAIQNLKLYLEGKPLLNLVTPEIYDRST